MTLTAEDLAKLPRATVTTKSEGIAVTYEGMWLREVLKKAGAPGGTELRGKALTGYVLAEAKDGNHVVFSLAGVDPVFTADEFLLVDKADGIHGVRSGWWCPKKNAVRALSGRRQGSMS